MIYAMSDIHGQYEQFLTLLEQIGIRKEDTLYLRRCSRSWTRANENPEIHDGTFQYHSDHRKS